MLLDPFSNVVQFVGFDTKYFAGAAELYHSVDGTLTGSARLETITKGLCKLSAELRAANFHGTKPVTADVKNLTALALPCQRLADEMERLPVGTENGRVFVKHLPVPGNCSNGRASMERLDIIRSQMTGHLVAIPNSMFAQTYSFDL